MKPYESPWMDDDLRMLREAVSRFVETEMLPQEPRWRAEHRVDYETWRAVGEAGFLLMDVPAEYGGGGGDFRHESVLYEETGPARHLGFRPGRAQHRRALRAQLRQRGAEAALAAAHGERRARRRHRDDRARRRFRPQGHSHEGGARRRPLCRQRLEDLHHQRLHRDDPDAGRAHGCRGPQARPVDPDGRDEGPGRLPRRPRAGQDGHDRPGHRGALLRGRARARRTACSAARKARGCTS